MTCKDLAAFDRYLELQLAKRSNRGGSTPLLTARKTVKQHFSAKEKGKDKAEEPELSTAMDEQLAHLLQWLHKAIVLEDVSAEILNNPVVQGMRPAWTSSIEHWERGRILDPEGTTYALKDPLTNTEGNDMVPAGDDQGMDELSDFKAASSSARPSKPVVAQVKPSKPVATKEGTSKPSTKKAGTKQSTAMVTEADNSMVIATPIAFPAHVPQGAEAGVIKVLNLRTYVMPGVLPQEYRPPVH
ncbi:hypothetical protein E4T56_gene12823 [Termitomyces sp. T112]|nr:hypothetical protein E4T56_gene12823 [Termitomyces sp. T112]